MHIIADCTHISIECEIGVENDSKSGYLVCGSWDEIYNRETEQLEMTADIVMYWEEWPQTSPDWGTCQCSKIMRAEMIVNVLSET